MMKTENKHICFECKHYPVTLCPAELKDVVITNDWGQHICECKYFEPATALDKLQNAVTDLVETLKVTRPFCWLWDFLDWLSDLLSK